MPDSIVSLGSGHGVGFVAGFGSSLRGVSSRPTAGATAGPGAGMELKAGGKKDDPAKIHGAAQQFESLLISQILKSAHGDAEGWLGTGDDQAASAAMGIAEEQLAQALSTRGGLGLANLIEKGLTKSTNATDR